MNHLTKDEPFTLDDVLWERLIELTDGAVALCYQCGTCTAICPWGVVRDEAVSIRTFMRQAQLGIHDGDRNLWLCTTCAQCEPTCPRGVTISDVFRGLRSLSWERRDLPQGLPSMLWSVYWNNNPWDQPPSQRSDWAKTLDLPSFDPAEHEILYYIGCTSSYDRRAQQVALALTHLFNAAGVSFGTLGDEEPCCGEAVLSVGHKPYFQEIATQNVSIFEERGVNRLVTVSPHCYDVFRNHYPTGLEAYHYTQYLASLIDEGRLQFRTPIEHHVTYHDPCYLARHNQETRAPRRVLEAIPGLELIEMEQAQADTVCCGGGGGRMWLETDAGERFGDLRVRQALDTGAEVLLTACPYCIACLEYSIKARKIKDLVVMDVAEIAALSL
jgi:Fe-S oxidoreductase